MEPITKPNLRTLGIKLPASAKSLLRCGDLTIYDLLELLTNTLSKVVVGTDSNAAAMEAFAGALAEWADDASDNIDKWKVNALSQIIKTLKEDGIPLDLVMTEGSVLWSHLSEEVQKKIQKGGSGSLPVTGVSVNTKGELVIALGGEEDDDVSGTIAFANALPAAPPPVPGQELVDDSKRGGLMSKADWDDLQTLKAAMPTVDDDGFLVIGNKKYLLTAAYTTETFEYSEIKVEQIIYDTSNAYIVNANGTNGTRPKSISYSAKRQTKRDGVNYGELVSITGTIKYDNANHANDVNELGATVSYSLVEPVEGASISTTTGVVSCSHTSYGYNRIVGKVNVSLTIGGSSSVSCNKYDAYQQAASIGVSKTSGGTSSASVTLTPGSTSGSVDVYIKCTGSAAIDDNNITVKAGGNADIVTSHPYDSTLEKLTIHYSANSETSSRSCTLQIPTNVFKESGSTEKKVLEVTITQEAAKINPVAYWGRAQSTSVPTSIDQKSGEKDMVSDAESVEIENGILEGMKCNWVAVPVGSGYNFVNCQRDQEVVNVSVYPDDQAGNPEKISGYILYFYAPSTGSSIAGKSSFNFTKQAQS